jgi:hypothetical protein
MSYQEQHSIIETIEGVRESQQMLDNENQWYRNLDPS